MGLAKMTEQEIRAIVQEELRCHERREAGLWQLLYRFFMGVARAIEKAKLCSASGLPKETTDRASQTRD